MTALTITAVCDLCEAVGLAVIGVLTEDAMLTLRVRDARHRDLHTLIHKRLYPMLTKRGLRCTIVYSDQHGTLSFQAASPERSSE